MGSCTFWQRLRVCIMRAVRVAKFGGPKVMKVENEVPIPKPKASQVLIKVTATGVNPLDIYIRAGDCPALVPTLPYTPGWDVAGVVEEVGSEVKEFKKGDRVFTFRTVSGGCAEYCTAEANATKHLKNMLNLDQGAGVGVPYFTAYKTVQIVGKAKPGETMLVHGASGSVGLACVQYGRHIGLRILGTAGSQAGLDLVKGQGAEAVFNHKKKNYISQIMDYTEGKGLDIIVEMMANINLQNDLSIVAKKGRILVLGSLGSIEVTPGLLFDKQSSVTGVSVFSSSREEWQEMSSAVASGLEQGGWVQPQIAKVYNLDQASQAHYDIMNSSGAKGRLIIKPA